jgi:hypothetical protein
MAFCGEAFAVKNIEKKTQKASFKVHLESLKKPASTRDSLVIHWHHASQSAQLAQELTQGAEKHPLRFIHQFWKEQRSFEERLEPDFSFFCSPGYLGPKSWVERYVVVGPRKNSLPAFSRASTRVSLSAFYEHLWKARLLTITRGDGSTPHQLEQLAWRSYLKLGSALVPAAPQFYVYPESTTAGLEKAEKLKAFYMVDQTTWQQEGYRLDMDVWLEDLPELDVPCYFELSKAEGHLKKERKEAFLHWIWLQQVWLPWNASL